ncbi:MAG: DUF169 domain-containing protein [Dehalococcoidales bacterium]|nr:DUF169 domain-containing protein [Dehalococcoidales bacterium]
MSTKWDFAKLNDFDFAYKPIAMKFLLNKPAGMKKLAGGMPICQMFREAQDMQPFYASAENFTCVDRLLMGFMEPEPIYESGQIGAKEHIYQDARANRRIYQYIPKIPAGTVRHVAFASIDEIPFDPDLLILTARPDQAEIILRALSYSIGKPITTMITPVLMCAWLFFYPYMTGNLNYTVTGLGYGMKSKKLLPEGLLLITVPYDHIRMLLDNLAEMEWVLPMFTMPAEEKAAFAAKIMGEIRQDYLNG